MKQIGFSSPDVERLAGKINEACDGATFVAVAEATGAALALAIAYGSFSLEDAEDKLTGIAEAMARTIARNYPRIEAERKATRQ